MCGWLEDGMSSSCIAGRAYARGGGTGVLAPNGSMMVHNNNVIVSGEAILSAENSEKPSGGRSSASNPTGELTALPQTP